VVGIQVVEEVQVAGQATGRRTRREFTVGWRILREAILLAAMFAVYSAGRMYAAGHSGPAFENADRIWGWEQALALPSEVALQHAVLQVPYLAQSANSYYALVHFPLTAAVLLWLSIRRPHFYPRMRWAMISLTLLALVGHIVFPLAPPRMLPHYGFVDTGVRYGQSVYGHGTQDGLANQFAAMPSLHVGWAAMIALAMIMMTTSRRRWLWLLHPAITLFVVVATANHYWMDGIVVLVLMACCLPLLADRPAGKSVGYRAEVG
jgi:hypothetical protein